MIGSFIDLEKKGEGKERHEKATVGHAATGFPVFYRNLPAALPFCSGQSWLLATSCYTLPTTGTVRVLEHVKSLNFVFTFSTR